MPPSMTKYDEIPYRSAPFPQTRPDRLAAIAKLFGLNSPPPATARVLELGCATGGNLLAMAHDNPQGVFVGIDASSRQIADAWSSVQALGLNNITFQHLDIAELNTDVGEFDYIICHGVYSWVQPAIQSRILEVIQKHLAHNGVGYVSYNTFPGWHIRGIVRDMMRYHGNQFADRATQLAQAKALVEFIADTGKVQDSKYKQILRDEFENIRFADDAYLHHDHLEENNFPLYFHEFAKRLAVHGLQFLGEAEFSTMVSTNFAKEIADTLQRLGAHDVLQMEQYMDYVRCRYFRQSLICKRAVVLNRSLHADQVKEFHFSANASPVVTDVPMATDSTVEFKIPSGAGLNCRHPLTKAALQVLLRAWPSTLSFSELYVESKLEAAQQNVSNDLLLESEFLASDLLSGIAAGVIEWRLDPKSYAKSNADRPTGSRLARHLASSGNITSNLRGEQLTLDLIHRHVLLQLDGTHDRDYLTESLAEFIAKEGHVLRKDGDDSPVSDPTQARQILRPAVDKILANLARTALLVS
jgi:methyltransferase-like protein/SAM-dependent methyltransferase